MPSELSCPSSLAVGRACCAPKDKDALLQCQSRAGGCWKHSRGCSVATRGLSSLWVALVPCQQVHTHPMQGCPKPVIPVFLKELIAHRCCKSLSRKFVRLFLPRAVWLSGCGLACRRCSCRAAFSGLLSWWCDQIYLLVLNRYLFFSSLLAGPISDILLLGSAASAVLPPSPSLQCNTIVSCNV